MKYEVLNIGIATAKVVRTFSIPETLDSKFFFPYSLVPSYTSYFRKLQDHTSDFIAE
jgi:hypothetical protein